QRTYPRLPRAQTSREGEHRWSPPGRRRSRRAHWTHARLGRTEQDLAERDKREPAENHSGELALRGDITALLAGSRPREPNRASGRNKADYCPRRDTAHQLEEIYDD